LSAGSVRRHLRYEQSLHAQHPQNMLVVSTDAEGANLFFRFDLLYVCERSWPSPDYGKTFNPSVGVTEAVSDVYVSDANISWVSPPACPYYPLAPTAGPVMVRSLTPGLRTCSRIALPFRLHKCRSVVPKIHNKLPN
jgi:hypothetical protein